MNAAISHKAMEGQNGFLFLNGRDSNNLVEHLTGSRPLHPAAVTIHEANRRVIEGIDCPFLGIIVPEAHCMYPEYLPKGMSISEGRPARQALAHMAPGYEYALEILSDFRDSGGTVYTGRDSHWTQTAALKVWMELRGRVGRTSAFEAAYSPSDSAEVGDLAIGNESQARQAEKKMRATLQQASYRQVFGSKILNHGNVLVAHNPSAKGRCLAFGTSFSTRLVPAYASDFEETYFCYGTTIDPFMIDFIKPDCVISELPERFLHFPAISVRGSTLTSLLLGLSDNGESEPPGVAYDNHSNDFTRLVRALRGTFRQAGGEVDRALMSAVEACDLSVAKRLALLTPLMRQPRPMGKLRLLLSGQFFNNGVHRHAMSLVDNQTLSPAHLDLLPDSEGGHLIKTRILIRAGLWKAATDELAVCEEMFGSRDTTEYYKNLVRSVPSEPANLPRN